MLKTNQLPSSSTRSHLLIKLLMVIGVSRTSDGGNGNQSVSLPIILLKIKVDQMILSSYISSLLVSIL